MDEKDFPIDGTPASGDGSGPRSDRESQPKGTKSVSAQKLAANRKNAKRARGPETEQGKANSSRNSLVHGFFARKLLHDGQGTVERQQYEELGAGLKDYYQPIGFMEQLLVEEIFVELVRQGRLLRYEQRVLSEGNAFVAMADKVLRYQSAQNRHLAQLMKDLERLQENRQASGRPEPSGPDSAYPLAESVDTTTELVATAAEPLAGDRVHPSPEASENVADPGQATEKVDRHGLAAPAPAVRATESYGGRADISDTNLQPLENRGTNRTTPRPSDPGNSSEHGRTSFSGQSLTDLIEKRAGLPPREQPNSNLSLTENCETNPPSVSGRDSKEGEKGNT